MRRIRKLSGGQFSRRTGASLQCRGVGRAEEPQGDAAPPAADPRATGHACGLRSRRVPTGSAPVWCAGGGAICRPASLPRSALPCRSAASASNWHRWGFGDFRCARSTRSRTRKPNRRSKKLPRGGSGGNPRTGTGQAAGDMVPRVSRTRKPSGGGFSRRTRGLASKAPSPASGPNAAPDPRPSATRDTSGPTSSERFAQDAPWRRASCCPSPTPTR